MIDPIARLTSLLQVDEIEAAERLASTLGQEVGEVKQLVRVLEDIAIHRRYNELLVAGESKLHAAQRTAQEVDMNAETVRSRIKGLTV